MIGPGPIGRESSGIIPHVLARLILFVSSAACVSVANPWTPEDVARLRSVTQAEISPNSSAIRAIR